MNIYYITKDQNGSMIIGDSDFKEVLLFNEKGDFVEVKTVKDFHYLRKLSGSVVKSEGMTAQQAILNHLIAWQAVCNKDRN